MPHIGDVSSPDWTRTSNLPINSRAHLPIELQGNMNLPVKGGCVRQVGLEPTLRRSGF